MESIVGIKNIKCSNPETLTTLARCLENCDMFPEMYSVMNKLVALTPSLSIEQRNLLSIAYKNVISPIRCSLRMIYSELEDNPEGAAAVDLTTIKKIRESELQKICNHILETIEKTIMPKIDKGHDEEQIFFLKMKADYNRYLAETDKAFSETTLGLYKKAHSLANEHLARTHPTRLSILLNYSVCIYEISQKPVEAYRLAKEGFDEAMKNLENVEENDYHDSTLIMQLLRDNITLWTSDSAVAEQNAGTGDKVEQPEGSAAGD